MKMTELDFQMGKGRVYLFLALCRNADTENLRALLLTSFKIGLMCDSADFPYLTFCDFIQAC